MLKKFLDEKDVTVVLPMLIHVKCAADLVSVFQCLHHSTNFIEAPF